MIVETVKNLEIKDLTNNSASILADISVKAKGHLFKILTKNFYSNPIGSLVREIASNAWDANVDNNSNKAIIISLMEDKDTDNDDERYYISFKDFGKGMSPDFIRNTYFQFGESTKQNDNNQIGGFGLGKGSILAYSDIAYISTISEGIKYDYLLTMGEELPTLDLMNEEECLDDTGTEVKVYIKNIYDVREFHKECINQLYYFQNVYYNSNIVTFNNNYKIFTYKTFKYRNDAGSGQRVTTINYNGRNSETVKTLTLILGKVQYPIDFNLLGIQPINMPISIYFEIGEIQPTPNRESIIYTPETKELIINKINDLKNEILELHSKEVNVIESYKEYYKVWNIVPFINIRYEDKIYPIILDGQFCTGKYQSTYKYFNDIEFFNDLDSIPSIDRVLKSLYTIKHRYGSNCKLVDRTNYYETRGNIYLNTNNVNLKFDKIYALEKFLYADIIERVNLLEDFRDYFRFEYHKRLRVFQSNNEAKSQVFGNEYGVYFKLGEHKKLYTLVKQIRKEIEEGIKILQPLTNDEEQEIRDYFRKEKYERSNNVPNVSINGYNYKTYSNQQFNLKELQKQRMIVYSFKDESDYIDSLKEAIYELTNKKSFCYYTFIKISKTNEKYLKNMTNTIKISEFMEGVDCREFRRIASCIKIQTYIKDLMENQSSYNIESYIQTLSNFNTQVGYCLNELYKYYNRYWKNNDSIEEKFRTAILNVAKEKNLFDTSIDYLFIQLDEWFKGVEIIKKVDINESSIPFVIQLLRDNKKRLNLDWYQRFTEIEKWKLPKEKDDKGNEQLTFQFETITQHQQTKYKFITKN